MKKTLRLLVLILILAILTRAILENWSQIQEKLILANPGMFILFLVVLVGTHLLGAYFWYKIIHLYSSSISFKEALRIFVVSNFGRFVPGVALHYAARVYLSKKVGIGVKEGVSLVILEAYYTLAGAFALSFAAIQILLQDKLNNWFYMLLFVSVLIFIFVMPPQLVFKIARKFAFVKRYIPVLNDGKFKWHTLLLAISAFSFFLNGFAFWLLSASMHNTPFSLLFPFVGLFCISWMIGFLTPVAPGGLGVTDLTFAFLLSSYFDFSFASFLVLVYRFGLILSEGIVFLYIVKLFGLDVVYSRRPSKA